jgi:hypothetical protein
MTVWEAINEMRKGGEFSFSFVSFDRERQDSQGMVHVRRAILRPQSKKDDVVDAEYKLNYFDMELGVPRNCWQPLIKEFNGQKLEI